MKLSSPEKGEKQIEGIVELSLFYECSQVLTGPSLFCSFFSFSRLSVHMESRPHPPSFLVLSLSSKSQCPQISKTVFLSLSQLLPFFFCPPISLQKQ
uniref:Uncharacterized protein n=1 Tax=Rhizophora mucronata TaxID=61149 RepID=A0A2P2N7F6_RHIMU